ncbi:rhodanese-like domain-containing protein [Candidatus Neomarinimicrobiota bacterium]
MKYLKILFIVISLLIFSCSSLKLSESDTLLLIDKDEDPINEFNVLVEYLEGTDGGYINNMGSWILAEKDVKIEDYLVIDLRSAEAFNVTPNPISGAVNTTLGDMFNVIETHAKTTSSKILITCYSGHRAAFAHTLLRMKGYEAYSMKFGMSWHDQSLDKWTEKCSDKNADDLVMTASRTLPAYDYPELNTGEETGEDILDERIEATIALWGTLLVSTDEAIANKESYNIMNYWSEGDYVGYGHIEGAYQLTPGTLTVAENLSAINPTGANLIYCYTGQTATALIAYLSVLGYDVKSIAYGFNNMNWSELSGNKWPKPYNN